MELILDKKVSSSCVLDFFKNKINPKILDRTVYGYNVDNCYPSGGPRYYSFP